jgi:ribosomal protein S24E
MNVNILTTTENKLLERKEVQAEVSFDAATPKRAELKTAVSHKIGANPELVVIRSVKSLFGRKTVKITAHAYSNKETLMGIEPIHIKVREGLMAKPEKKKAAPVAKKPRKT